MIVVLHSAKGRTNAKRKPTDNATAFDREINRSPYDARSAIRFSITATESFFRHSGGKRAVPMTTAPLSTAVRDGAISKRSFNLRKKSPVQVERMQNDAR
jgi:hypothetical protein